MNGLKLIALIVCAAAGLTACGGTVVVRDLGPDVHMSGRTWHVIGRSWPAGLHYRGRSWHRAARSWPGHP
ncbi:MAG: hypothetical protein ABFS30_16380, partial [Pseudomonadota bacterium]